MPHYFFHLHDDANVPDEEGAELPHLDAAKDYTVRQARALIGEGARTNGKINLGHRIDIEDAEGKVVATVRFGDVLTIRD